MLVGWESMGMVLVPNLISSQGSENNANIWFPSRNYWNGSQGKYLCVCVMGIFAIGICHCLL